MDALYSRLAPLGVAIAFGALGAHAQAQATTAQSIEPPALFAGDAWRLPIHGDGASSSYGLWAAGPDYKVSFGPTIAFYPALDEAYERNLPVRWTTTSFAIGSSELLDATALPEASHEDWQYVLRRGGMEEIYDVRRDGVEQSFRLHERCGASGDLVIAGRVESELRAVERPYAHGPLTFADERGTPLVTYGAAVAFDACGATMPVESSFEDGVLRLRLAGAWLASATYPVTVDPLLARVAIAAGSLAPGFVDVVRNDEQNLRLFSYARRFSATDYDLYSRVTDDDGTFRATYYSDVSANWSTQHFSATHVGGGDKWVLAFERLTLNDVRLYAHVRDDGPAPAAGTTVALARPAATQQRYPSLGGVRGYGIGTQALLVFQEDIAINVTNTSASHIRAALLDVAVPSFGTSFPLSINTLDADSELPSVSRFIDGPTDAWLVSYQQYDNTVATDDWEVAGLLVRPDGALSPRKYLAFAQNGTHAIYAKVDGRGGRFLLAFGSILDQGRSHGRDFRSIVVGRIDWAFGASDPTYVTPKRTLRSSPTLDYSFGGPSSRPISYDFRTRSHWALGWIDSDRIAAGVRLGFDAGAVESATLYSVPLDLVQGISVAFDRFAHTFAFAYGVLDQGGVNPIYQHDLAFQPATATTYGASCSGAIQGLNLLAGSGDPWAGSEFYAVGLSAGAANSASALLLALAPASLPLGNGCELLLDPATFFLYASGVSDVAGQIQFSTPLVSFPFFTYDVYWQWVQIDAANGQPVLSDGLRTQIR